MKTGLSIGAPAALTLLLMSAAAPAATVQLGSVADNTLYQSDTGSLSNGAGMGFFAGVTAEGLVRRGLIRFDVASVVPAGSTITAATLTLHCSQASPGNHVVSLHRVLAAWGEGTSNPPLGEGPGAPATPGDATWLHTFYPDQFWTNPGGDFEPLASASQLVGGQGFYSWSSDGVIADIQGWLNNPAANFGWLLMGNEAALQTAKRFNTHEHPTVEIRPVLTIEYLPVPSPGAGVMLIAGLALRRRRR